MPLYMMVELYVIIFLFGIEIGSFLNVCIYRIPEKQSIVPNSHCMSCGHQLHWYDLFPLFSWLFLKGKCRYCGVKISMQYPMIELLNGILWVVVFAVHGFHINTVLFWIMTPVLIVIGMVEDRYHRIPISLNLFLLAVGIAVCVADRDRLLLHLSGSVCVSSVLYMIYIAARPKWLNNDDIILAGAAGLILGWQRMLIAFALGCVIGAVCYLLRRKVGRREQVFALGTYLVMAVYLCALC